MTKWDEFEMERKITEVLSSPAHENEHHFRRSFLTPYQIAIELTRMYPTICQDLGKELGGAGTGLHHSLTQYIARELSQRIKRQEIQHIKGAFLSNMHLTELVYKTLNGTPVRSSTTDESVLSMFRLRQR